MRGDVFPDVAGFGGKQFFHGDGVLFSRAAALNRADGLSSNVLRSAMQPAGQDGTIDELSGALCQRHEHTLGHILRQMRVADHAPGGGIDQIHVAAHQFVESSFRPAFSVSTQQLSVALIVHSSYVSRRRENRTGKGADWSWAQIHSTEGICEPNLRRYHGTV